MDFDFYEMTIDYQDITSYECLELPNEESIFNDDLDYVRTNPHNYIIQLEVSAINGLSVVEPKKGTAGWDPKEKGAVLGPDKVIERRSKTSLANIFFQVSQLNPAYSFGFSLNTMTRKGGSWQVGSKKR